MAKALVLIYNKALDVEYMAPAAAVEMYKGKGWKKGGRPKTAAKKENASD